MTIPLAPLRVLITSAYADPEPLSSFLALANQDRFGVHPLTDDPDVADIILFVENPFPGGDPNYKRLRSHPWVRQYREKVFMFNEQDKPRCVLPGVYCSMPRRQFNEQRLRTTAYITVLNPFIGLFEGSGPPNPEYLFAFVGSRTAPVRRRVIALQHERGYIKDTSGRHHAISSPVDKSKHAIQQMHYARVVTNSKFILCPRGVGASSFRLFETLRAGRVPVIVSDDWVETTGPDWPSFSVRVAEADVDQIPKRLEAIEDQWKSMSMNARLAWEEWFAPDVLYHRIVEQCADILASRRWPEAVSQRLPQLRSIEWRAALETLRHSISG